MSEYENGDGCLSHIIVQHIQVRRDFLEICGYDVNWFNLRKDEKGKIVKDEPNVECMAKILRLIETLTDKKRREWHGKAEETKSRGLALPKEPDEYPLELAYSAICQLLFYTYGQSTVSYSIAALIRFGYIKRYPSTTNNIPKYALNIKVVQMALKRHAQEAFENGNLGMSVKNNRLPVENNRLGVENNRLPVENKTQPVENNNNNIGNNNTNNIDERKEDRFVRKFSNLRTHIHPFSLLQEKFDPWHKKASQGDYVGALESVRIGWNRQFLDPMRSYPERVRISSRDDANDELSCTPVSPLFLPIAIPVPWYFPYYAFQDANALT